MSFTGLRASSVRLALLLSSLLVCRVAAAQVVEPNGVSVPAATTDPVSLQQYFTSVNENISAVANASITPATFLPLCDFQATLVLNQSQGMAGLSWYNVPTSPTAAPTQVYAIGTPPLVLGATIGSSDIRSNTGYLGGLIGFALTRNNGTGTPYLPVYYSEDMRNVDCTGCTGANQTPPAGYWKMMLSYQSTVTPNSYYMAWEDWPGADQNSWQGNDGDFNDQVFKVTGVTCNGGGVPCTVPNALGVCSLGVTQCEAGGTIVCKPTVTATAEKCDNLDNDCDGQVDNGSNLCPTNQVCVQGTCTNACDGQEFECQLGWQCQNGLCVDPKCVGVTCQAGQICQAGNCVGGCDGVTCPLGQECQLGVCIDPCAGVSCPNAVCDRGACVTVCSCQPCPSGQVCTTAGSCVDTGCDTMTCPAGDVCQAGACIDACTGAVCPGGAACHNGVCDMPPTGQTTSTGTGGTTGAAGTTGTGNSGGATGQGGASATTGAGGSHGGAAGVAISGGGGSTTTTGPHEAGGEVGCSCTAAGAGHSGTGALLLFLAAAIRPRMRRRAARRA